MVNRPMGQSTNGSISPLGSGQSVPKVVVNRPPTKERKKLIQKKTARARDIYIREQDFLKDLNTYPQFSTIVKEFFDYWSEPNKSKTKMRFEQQKTWDTKRRLQRWANNNFGEKGQAPDRSAQIKKEEKEASIKHLKMVKGAGPPPPEAVKALKNLGIRMGERTEEAKKGGKDE